VAAAAPLPSHVACVSLGFRWRLVDPDAFIAAAASKGGQAVVPSAGQGCPPIGTAWRAGTGDALVILEHACPMRSGGPPGTCRAFLERRCLDHERRDRTTGAGRSRVMSMIKRPVG